MDWLPRAAALRCRCAVAPQIKAIAHDPSVWPEPLSFKPERFLPGGGGAGRGGLDAFASVPFSAGARSCIGKRFSLLEAKTVLAMILARFTPHSPPPRADEVVEAVTSRPKHGMRLSLRLRNDLIAC
jgi:cytochrome P450|eukprot:COSAG01_NODE_7365_length_3235_cov_112.430804_4_plen_127_part_00